MIDSATKSWFRQLRRLQSYVAGVRVMKMTPEALAYRLELGPAFADQLVLQIGRVAILPSDDCGRCTSTFFQSATTTFCGQTHL